MVTRIGDDMCYPSMRPNKVLPNEIPTKTEKLEWVKVQDRLPERDHYVLIYASGIYREARWGDLIDTADGQRKKVGIYWQDSIDLMSIEGVTHWRELPEKPND